MTTFTCDRCGAEFEDGIDAGHHETECDNRPRIRARRISRAQALVNYGLADSLADARAQLVDMGELS